MLAVVRENYDTLTLKLQDNLDSYTAYAATDDADFLHALVRSVVVDHGDMNLLVTTVLP